MTKSGFKSFLFFTIASLLVSGFAHSVLADHVPPSRYARWHTVLDSYPGGSFWSPQPVASTPIYSYYDDYYRGYNYPYRYSDPFGRYGYNRGSYDYYHYYSYPNHPYDGYYRDGYYPDSRYNSDCYRVYGYSDPRCQGRIVYPQSGLGYYYDDPYYSTGVRTVPASTASSSAGYPNYLSYGWEY